MHPQRNLIEAAMNIAEAQTTEKSLTRGIGGEQGVDNAANARRAAESPSEAHIEHKTALTNIGGIDPNHKDWENVEHHSQPKTYTKNVLDVFHDEIHTNFVRTDPDRIDRPRASMTIANQRTAAADHFIKTANNQSIARAAARRV